MQLITPRQFCRIYFKIDHLPEEDIQQIEKSRGYKSKCSSALAHVLGMSRHTLINSRYRKSLEFEGLSDQARATLTLWVIEKRYQEKISRLEASNRELRYRLQSRGLVAAF